MTDREMLELAAKAAGPTIVFGRFMNYPIVLTGNEKDGDPVVPWLPLADDGDALRLAATLGLSLRVLNMTMGVSRLGAPGYLGGWLDRGLDDAADYRRAIVRAAAEVGAGLRPFPTVEEIHQIAGTEAIP